MMKARTKFASVSGINVVDIELDMDALPGTRVEFKSLDGTDYVVKADIPVGARMISVDLPTCFNGICAVTCYEGEDVCDDKKIAL